MTTFPEREAAFEAKFAHDEELAFLVGARRDKLFASWTADRLAMPDADRADLIASTLALRDHAGHDDNLIAHISDIFLSHGNAPARPELAGALRDCEVLARRQLMSVPADADSSVRRSSVS